MTNALRRLSRAQVVVALVAAVLAVLGTGRVASAHTDFESSVPADGATVEGPLNEIIVSFTNPAQPAGEEFELLDPNGTVRSPTLVNETDGTSFILTFDPPLDAGTYGLRWSVQAGDAHPIDGSFQFDVTEAATRSTLPADAATSDVTGTPPADEALSEFLDAAGAGEEDPAAGRIGRTMTILGMIFGGGVLAALVWTLRGSRHELLFLASWVRLAGLVVFAGGLIEYAALADGDPSATFGELLTTRPGLAAALKTVGGLGVLFGLPQRAGRIIAPARSLSSAAAGELILDAEGDSAAVPAQHEYRWAPTSAAAIGIVGYALVFVSFSFDGHTVTRGPWVIHSLVNLVHLGAAAAWGGGVFAMTAVVWMRSRRSERVGLAEMVVRFSAVASVSLAAVTAAGLLMTWMIIDTPGDLFSTDWGRTLIAKTFVVATAAGFGGYNHLRLRPALERRPADPQLARELRISLSFESAAFVAVVVLTAILVASST